MRHYWFAVALLILVTVGCTNTTSSEPQPVAAQTDQTGPKLERQIAELAVQVDRLAEEVSKLSAEVGLREPASSFTTTYNPSPFLDRYLVQAIEESNQLPDTFWEERLEQARLGSAGGLSAYEDVLIQREIYKGWLDYTSWLKKNNKGFVRGSWQVGDEQLSRLDFLQLQVQWLAQAVNLFPRTSKSGPAIVLK